MIGEWKKINVKQDFLATNKTNKTNWFNVDNGRNGQDGLNGQYNGTPAVHVHLYLSWVVDEISSG